jgi:hypothetical protein
MNEEVRQSAAREADLPAIFHKPWQAEIHLLARPHLADVWLPL